MSSHALRGRSTLAILAVLALLAPLGCKATSGSSDDPDRDAAASGDPRTESVAPVETEPSDPTAPDSADEHAKIDDAPEQFRHAGLALGLWPEDCLLVAESETSRVEHRFVFPGPCHFVATDAGDPLGVETDGGLALMVEGSKQLERDCDTALRVVILSDQGPRLSRAVQRVQICAPAGGDEMMFHVLASEPVVFGTAGGDP